MDKAFRRLTGGSAVRPVTLTVMGRELVVPQASDGVARFDFDSLCNTALGAGDYLAIATHFHTVILDGIPGCRRTTTIRRGGLSYWWTPYTINA